ncbi:hypothetical protein P7F88_01795 [Vibrio hannami]|uniref:hypothetical protein n=1 Tax=Vibrio hannami TaxID=2717094 RepID=UPI00240F4D6F|nr:hypothetical protein [Vibrio hannami]MDG3084888.1 hypothetical protein [Vibrio hannami]
MELKKDPRCYTDVCINGKWFHHDHLTTKAYMLKGGASPEFDLAKVPTTEDELIEMLNNVEIK